MTNESPAQASLEWGTRLQPAHSELWKFLRSTVISQGSEQLRTDYLVMLAIPYCLTDVTKEN
jgi:hypothetical protein